MRAIFQQARMSRLPSVVGLPQTDVPSVAAVVNEITQRLHFAGGNSGWWGAWARVAFTASQANPYITLPSLFARAINLTVCQQGIRLQNEFYEMMEAGIGLQPPNSCNDWCGALEGYERGLFSTLVDLPTTGQYYLRLYPADASDAGKHVLFQRAKDVNDNYIYTNAIPMPMNGLFVELEHPFVTTTDIVTAWDSIVKDTTAGDVVLKAVDATTGEETTLSRYFKWETNPAYRRYYLNSLPASCCPVTTPGTVAIEAMCKYEFLPVAIDTDPLLIGNVPALIEEAQALRASGMEDSGAGTRVARHHMAAIKLLQDEMRHYLGSQQPAINFAPFGTATLDRKMIGNVW